MIDLDREEPIPLGQGAREINPSNPPSTTTLWRWTTKGVRGRVLETVAIGGRVYTTREAIQRFASHRGGDVSPPASRTTKQREKAIAKAEAELRAAGV